MVCRPHLKISKEEHQYFSHLDRLFAMHCIDRLYYIFEIIVTEPHYRGGLSRLFQELDVSDPDVRIFVRDVVQSGLTGVLVDHLPPALLAVGAGHHQIKLVEVGGGAAHPGLDLLLTQPGPDDLTVGEVGGSGKLAEVKTLFPQMDLSQVLRLSVVLFQCIGR